MSADIKLSLYGIRCVNCRRDFVSIDRTMLELFAYEHVRHGDILYLCTVTAPPELRGIEANLEPIFKEQIV